jgi:lysophospholipase L1-like esterase
MELKGPGKKPGKKRFEWRNILLAVFAVVTVVAAFELFYPENHTLTELATARKPEAYMKDNVPLYHRDVTLALQKLPPKDSSRPRMIVIGDSFTYGPGVGRNETYPYVLGKLIESDGVIPEVINAGVPGYNLPQIKEVFDEALGYRPDIIIYGLYENDMFLTYLDRKAGVPYITDYNDMVPYIDVPGALFLVENLKIARISSRAVTAMPAVRDHMKISFYKPGWDRYEKMLEDMGDAAARSGSAFYIMVIPDLRECHLTAWTSMYPELGKEHAYSNLSAELEARFSCNYTGLRINDDPDPAIIGHPSAAGHRALAEMMYGFLNKRDAFGRWMKR